MSIHRWFYGLASAWLFAAIFYVELPFIEYSPGFSTDTSTLIALDTDEITPIHGRLELLAIRIGEPTLFELGRAWLSPERTLLEPSRVINPDLSEREYFANQRARFASSFDTAAAVGLERAGFDTGTRPAALVLDLVENGPAAKAGVVVGDVVVGIDASLVDSAASLVDAVHGAVDGQRFTLHVERDGTPLALTMEATSQGPGEPVRLGLFIDDVLTRPDLPFDVSLANPTGIGGPSAGLMFSLTVYDLVAPEDLARGRVIVGTGTMTPSGRVGAIGGIRQKVATARNSGAEIMLVPASQLEEALTADAGDMRVIGVATIDEAITALRGD